MASVRGKDADDYLVSGQNVPNYLSYVEKKYSEDLCGAVTYRLIRFCGLQRNNIVIQQMEMIRITDGDIIYWCDLTLQLQSNANSPIFIEG